MKAERIKDLTRKNIIFLGAPGAGKGTQATALAQDLGIPTISTGDILRKEIAAATPLGLEVKALVDCGKLVSNELVLRLVKKRLSLGDCEKGFILDGFPRTIDQAKDLDHLLSDLNKAISVVIFLDVPSEIIMQRVAERKAEDGSKRADDGVEVVRDRLNTYEEQTAPLLPYYKNRQLLVEIDGTASRETVGQEIKKIFQKENNS